MDAPLDPGTGTGEEPVLPPDAPEAPVDLPDPMVDPPQQDPVTEPPPAGGVGLFVAQGDMGRISVSCDDGRSWVMDESEDDSVRCYGDSNFDCNHTAGAARGIAFGDGAFVATFGWGQPGAVRRSRNAMDWEDVLVGQTFAGVTYGAGSWLAASPYAQFSTDGAGSWTAPDDMQVPTWNVRRSGFAAHGEGRFLMVGDDNAWGVSQDGGRTFAAPRTLPAACGQSIQWAGGIAYGAGVWLVVGGDGVACRSTDGGDTWVEGSVGSDVSGQLIWTGTEFMTWGGGQRLVSSDGASWTAQGMTPSFQIGAVARSDAGTFVAVNGNWQGWYENQQFYRSEDGLQWEALAEDRFVGSHPVGFIAFGRAEASDLCPEP